MQVIKEHQITTEFISKQNILKAYLFNLVGDLHAVEDILQEVWIRLNAHDEEEIENPIAWCHTVGKNLAMNYWREKGQQKINVNSDLLRKIDVAFEDNAFEEFSNDQRKQALQQCMLALPALSRQILELKYGQGLTFSELSKRLNKTESSLMMMTSRIRKKLQECIEKRLRIERNYKC